MNGFKAYTLYRAVYAHFHTSTYNAAEKNFGTKASAASYAARKDKYVFDKLAKLYPKEKELIHFYVANYMATKKLHPTTATQENYLKWLKVNSALEYHFREDMDTLAEFAKGDFKSLFECKNQHPKIFDLLLQKKILPESFIILDKIVPFIQFVSKRIQFRLVWDEYVMLYSKYAVFLEYDVNTMQKILVSRFNYLRKDSNSGAAAA